MKRCPYCGTTITSDDNFCFLCLRSFETPPPEDSTPPGLDLSKNNWRNSRVAAALSLVGVGLGQFYNGETAKGLIFLTGVLGALLVMPVYTAFDPRIVMAIIWAVAVLDAYASANKINRLKKEFRKKSILFWPEVAVLVLLAGFVIILAVAPHVAAKSISLAAGEVAATKYPAYAVPLYESAIAFSPNDTAIRMDEANVMLSLGRDKEARQDLEYVMATNPNETAPIVMTGNILYDQGQYEESIQYFEKALSLNQRDAQIWIRKGDASLALSIKDNQKIRANFQTLTTDNQDPAAASKETLATLEASQSYQDAMESYNHAIKIDPFVSVEISSHILASTQNLLNTEQGIVNDISRGNSTSG
jgi:TM2 domain-containing membrane protein YozV